MDSLNEHSTLAKDKHKKHQVMEGIPVITHKNSSHPNQEVSASLSNAERLEQLEEVKRELHKRQIEGEKVLMTTQEVKTIYGLEAKISKVITFFDDGSNCSVIRSKLAEEMGLHGDPITLSIGTVNARTNIDTKLYVVELIDNQGVRHMIRAFGIPEISRNIQAITIDSIKNQFSIEVQENWNSLQRPVGQVDILIGSEQAHLHPTHYETVGKMTVKRSIFGEGWVLNGCSEEITAEPVVFTQDIQLLRAGDYYTTNLIHVSYHQESSYNLEDYQEKLLGEKDFMKSESLGCEPPRRCGKCRDCEQCGFRGAHISPSYLRMEPW